MRECKHFHAPGALHEPCKDCLIEQQAERIKELEAYNATRTDEMIAATRRIKELESALCEEVEARSRWYCEADKLKEELAALRQRIDDAPVVAHITEDRKVFNRGFVRDTDKPLISKEDLK